MLWGLALALACLTLSFLQPGRSCHPVACELLRLTDQMGQTAGDPGRTSVRVLITGMSGSGKSTLVHELRRRGCTAYDADDDGFSEPRADGRWGWRAEAVASLLAQVPDGDVLFFAGCSEEQIEMPFDLRVVLAAPEDEILMRLRTRTSNAYGRMLAQRRQVLADLATVEPLLRRSADLVLSTTAPVAEGRRPAALQHVSDRGGIVSG